MIWITPFLVFSAGASLGFYIWMRSTPLIFLDQEGLKDYLYLNLFPLKLSWYLSSSIVFLVAFWLLYSRLTRFLTGLRFKISLQQDAISYLPLHLFLLNWLSFRYALYKPGYILPIVIFTFVLVRKYWFLRSAFRGEFDTPGNIDNKKQIRKTSYRIPVSSRRKSDLLKKPRPLTVAIFVFLFSLVFYLSLSAKLLFPLHSLVGDEPSYLMITDSLYKDWDVILNNNYNEQAYLRFFPGKYDTYGNVGREGGIYPRHGVGLSFLLIPFYYLGDKLDHMVFFPRSCLNLLTAVLISQVYLLAYEMSRSFRVSLATALIFGFTTPVLFFSYQIYPEIPTGLILLYAFRKWRVLYRRPLLYPALIGLVIALLPWLGAKYIILSFSLFLITGFRFIQYRSRFYYLSTFLFLFPILVSGVLHAWFIYSMYETISPTALYTGVDPTIKGDKGLAYVFNDLGFKIKRGLIGIPGIFLDQRIGLLFHSPIYFFSLAGILALWKRRAYRGQVLALLFLFLTYIFFYTYNPTAGWGGYSVMNRPVIAVIWILGIFMLFGLLSYRGSFALALRNGFLAFSLILATLYLKEPLLLYHSMAYRYYEIKSNLLYTYSSDFLDLTAWFPAIMKQDTRPGITLFWVGVTIVLLALCYYELKKRARREKKSLLPRFHTPTIPLLPTFLCFLLITGVGISFKDIVQRVQKTINYNALFKEIYENPAAGPSIHGLIGKYYDNDVWGGVPHIIRRDPSIHFIFTQRTEYFFLVKIGNFPLAVNLPSFSVEWFGCLQVPLTGHYRFEVTTSESAFFDIFIDGNPVVVNKGIPKELIQGNRSIHVRLREFKPRNSTLILYWTKPEGQKEVIPAEAFRPCVM
jgi:hypothetical protein